MELIAKGSSQGKSQNSKLKSSKGPVSHANLLVESDVFDSLSKPCKWLHSLVSELPDGNPIGVQMDMSLFHFFEHGTAWVTKDDICEFLKVDMLNISMIQVFMRSLQFDDFSSDSHIGWLDPQSISGASCMNNRAEVSQYLDDGIRQCTKAKNKFILAPYFEDLHWMLLVICVSSHTIYQFDSCRRDPLRSVLVKSLLNKVLMKMNVKKSALPQWKSVKCAQQEGGVECGYYVMKFMHDIFKSCKEVQDLEKVFKTPREEPFTKKELDEVRDKWAIYFNDCELPSV
ncbi:uncharacterized protein [Spinacia oleracea]|uniref:Uncharacterized protein isoform X1 n=2 Tax=Spinacia oleracea TaxID=3562 RepID=A0ABM3QHN1_SPIOL|nr:uncharacterized protein LOC110781724 isoform X1 [Spinacia oleracea]